MAIIPGYRNPLTSEEMAELDQLDEEHGQDVVSLAPLLPGQAARQRVERVRSERHEELRTKRFAWEASQAPMNKTSAWLDEAERLWANDEPGLASVAAQIAQGWAAQMLSIKAVMR